MKSLTKLPSFPLMFKRPQSILRVDKESLPYQKIKLLPKSKYGGETTVTLKCGVESLGRQGKKYLGQIIETSKIPIVFEKIHAERENEFLISIMRNANAIYLEPSADPEKKKPYMNLRNQLDLYASISNFFTVEGFNCKFPGTNILSVHQNNMGDYSKLEYEPVEDMVETLKIATVRSYEKFLRLAFTVARCHCRKKITVAHKVRNRPIYDGLFLDVVKRLHQCEFSQFELEFENVDALASRLVQAPQQFDVIFSNEQYGTTITAICAAVCGGIGMYSATELGDHHCLFIPLQIKLSMTKSMELSPYAVIMCVYDLLNHIGQHDCAENLIECMLQNMASGKKTQEFGGCDKGSYIICEICNALKCNFA